MHDLWAFLSVLPLEGNCSSIPPSWSMACGVSSYMSLVQADGIDKIHISSGGINENIPTICNFFCHYCLHDTIDTSVVLM